MIKNCADSSCSATGCTACKEGYYLNAVNGTCDLCSDAIPYCSACSSATQCTACSHESFIVSDAGACICDNAGKEETMIRNETTGFCSCTDGLFMDLNHGCLTCDYMIPGCRSCSQASWNSSIPLDNARMSGPDSDPVFLTCDACSTSERYVFIDAVVSDYTAIDTEVVTNSRVSCKHC